MPRVWRAMRMADGHPEVGRAGNLLGVRVGPRGLAADLHTLRESGPLRVKMRPE